MEAREAPVPGGSWKRLLIGYHASYAFHRRNAKVLEGRLGKLLAKHPHVDVVCNSFEMHELLGVPPGRRIVHPEYSFWTPGLPYPLPTKVASCDIGLVPLAPGRFNEGKSHLKGMEYSNAPGSLRRHPHRVLPLLVRRLTGS